MAYDDGDGSGDRAQAVVLTLPAGSRSTVSNRKDLSELRLLGKNDLPVVDPPKSLCTTLGPIVKFRLGGCWTSGLDTPFNRSNTASSPSTSTMLTAKRRSSALIVGPVKCCMILDACCSARLATGSDPD